MVFVAGGKTIPEFLNEIKSYLTATGDWEDADSGIIDGIALRHIPTNNYLSILKTWFITNTSNQYYRSAGLAIYLSSEWDSVNHVPSGSYHYVLAGLFEHNISSIDSYVDTYLSDYMGADNTYNIYYWVDKYGLIGVIANPNSYNPRNDTNETATVGCFIAIEYIPVAAREYNDGLSDFFLITKQNWQPRSFGDNADGYAHVCARPYSLSTPSKLYDQHERGAIRSAGTGKVYFEFPFYFDDSARTIVSAQSKRWFFVEPNAGIAVGDVISWIDEANAITRKFYVAEVDSANRSEKFTVAIPFENAYEYPTS